MDLFGANFGYDSYSPGGGYNLQPEDLNPALRNNYVRDVHDYYSEPPVSRFRNRRRPMRHKPGSCPSCSRSKTGSSWYGENSTLYILIIMLIVITIIQWIVIFCSSGGSVTINHNMTGPPLPMAVGLAAANSSIVSPIVVDEAKSTVEVAAK